MNAILAPENLTKLAAGVKEEFNKMLTSGFPAEEVAKGKAAWLQSLQVARTEDASLASVLSSNEYWGRTMSWFADLEARVAALTPDQVNAAVKKYIDMNSLSIVKAGDLKKAGISQ